MPTYTATVFLAPPEFVVAADSPEQAEAIVRSWFEGKHSNGVDLDHVMRIKVEEATT